MHPSDFHGQNSIVKDRMHAFRDEAARHRLVRRPTRADSGETRRPGRACPASGPGARDGRRLWSWPTGMALGASPMDNV